ncbi:MAG: exonuclease domain-containing protein [Phycisphaerales bacterium]|jgi:DNA polymerase-3 subunit epsilon|nr:exonuclease domain-containing protein [Phycisphaerales bacterium]
MTELVELEEQLETAWRQNAVPTQSWREAARQWLDMKGSLFGGGIDSRQWVERTAAIVDVETTGLSIREGAEIVEFAVVVFRFDAVTCEVVDVEEDYSGFQEPMDPIPPALSAIHGITDDMVRGQTLDLPRIETILQTATFVVAHNASFDKAFLEDILPATADLTWLCSCWGIPWKKSYGLPNRKLATIRAQLGVDDADAHRAAADVDVVFRVLRKPIILSQLLGFDA